MTRKLSRGQSFAVLAAIAGGVGLCVILVLFLKLPTFGGADLEGMATTASTSAPPPLSTSTPTATDTTVVASLFTSTVTATATPTPTGTARSTATLTHTPTWTVTATEAPSATPQPTLTATSTPKATAIPSPTVTPDAASGAGRAIIIDHTCTDLSRIPDDWLQEAKKLAIHYAHTSHGQQIIEGVMTLSKKSPQYASWTFYAGAAPSSLPGECADALCIYDGGPPDVTFWSTEEGRDQTRMVANTGLFEASMWSWCGQQSANETTTVQLYLETMHQFEEEHPGMRFILMTGHTDGGSATLKKNNDLVRQYVRDNGMVLFDFADIESYDPDGNYHPNTDDSCAWCGQWCATHPDDCTRLPDSCPHSHPFNCLRKAYAFWWMMARLAGWDGQVR